MNTASWPLVGRTGQLSRVVGAMDGDAGGVLLAGPAGVGKTRLAFECVTLAADRGYATAHVRQPELGDDPVWRVRGLAATGKPRS